MSDTNRYGYTDDEMNAIEHMEHILTGTGVTGFDLHLTLANFSRAINALAEQFPSPTDPKQQARTRSRRDVQRKRRGGKYRWGGQGDEK